MLDSMEPTGEHPPFPPIKVVRGNPTPEELAAALAVVRARTAATADTSPPRPGGWPEGLAHGILAGVTGRSRFLEGDRDM